MSYRKPNAREFCPVCGLYVGVKRDGLLYKHGRRDRPCTGATLDVVARFDMRKAQRRGVMAPRRAASEPSS